MRSLLIKVAHIEQRTKSPKDWDVKESLSVDLPSGFRKFYCPTLDPASPSFSPYSIINSDPAHREAWKKEVAKREVLVSEQGVGSGSREQLVVSTSGEQVEEWGRGGMGSLVAAKAEGSEGVGLRDLEGSGTDGLSCATSRERQAASVGMRQDLSANVPRPSNSNDPFPSFEPSSSTGLISSLTTNPLVPLGIPSPLPRAFAIPSPPPTAHPPIKLLTSITAPHTTPLSLDIRSELPKPSHSTQLPPAAETNLTRRGEDQNERPAPSSSSTSCRDCSQDHEYDPKHQTKDRRRPREHSMDTSLVRSRSKERSGHRSYSKDHSSHRSRRDRAHGEPAEQTHTSNFDSRPSSSNRDYDYSHHDSPYYDSPHDDLHTSRSRHLSLSSHQSSPGNDKPSRRRSRSPEPRREGRREDVSSSRRYPERAERNDRPSLGSQGSSYANRMAVHDETSEAAEDGIDIRISERHVPVQAGPKGTPITFDMAGVSLRGSKMYWMSEVGVRAAMRNSGTFSSHEGLQLCVDSLPLSNISDPSLAVQTSNPRTSYEREDWSRLAGISEPRSKGRSDGGVQGLAQMDSSTESAQLAPSLPSIPSI